MHIIQNNRVPLKTSGVAQAKTQLRWLLSPICSFFFYQILGVNQRLLAERKKGERNPDLLRMQQKLAAEYHQCSAAATCHQDSWA